MSDENGLIVQGDDETALTVLRPDEHNTRRHPERNQTAILQRKLVGFLNGLFLVWVKFGWHVGGLPGFILPYTPTEAKAV